MKKERLFLSVTMFIILAFSVSAIDSLDQTCLKLPVAGDTNNDGIIDVSDVIGILFHLFQGGELICHDNSDVNGDGKNDLSDAVYLLNYLFLNSGEQELPFKNLPPFLALTPSLNSRIDFVADSGAVMKLFDANFGEEDVISCNGIAKNLKTGSEANLFTMGGGGEILPYYHNQYDFVLDLDPGDYEVTITCQDAGGNIGIDKTILGLSYSACKQSGRICKSQCESGEVEVEVGCAEGYVCCEASSPVVEDHFCYSEHKDKCCAKINPATGREVSPPEYVCVKNCAYDKELADAVGDSDMGFLDRWVNGWDYAPNCADYIDENNPSLKEGEWSEASYDKCNDLLNGEGDFYETVDSCAKHSHNPDDGSVICGDKCEQAATFFEWIKQRNIFPDEGEIGIKPMSNEKTQEKKVQQLATAPAPSPSPSTSPSPIIKTLCKVNDLTIVHQGSGGKVNSGRVKVFPQDLLDPFNGLWEMQPSKSATGVPGIGRGGSLTPEDKGWDEAQEKLKLPYGDQKNIILNYGFYVVAKCSGEKLTIDPDTKEILERETTNDFFTEGCREYQLMEETVEENKFFNKFFKYGNVYPDLSVSDFLTKKGLIDMETGSEKLRSHAEVSIEVKGNKHYTSDESKGCGYQLALTKTPEGEPLPILDRGRLCSDNYYTLKLGDSPFQIIDMDRLFYREWPIDFYSSDKDSMVPVQVKKHNYYFDGVKGMYWYDAPQVRIDEGGFRYWKRQGGLEEKINQRFVAVVEDQDGNHRIWCQFPLNSERSIKEVSGKWSYSIDLKGPNICKCTEEKRTSASANWELVTNWDC